jgi:4-hydroxy-tetrahydrodipicolinate reductase
MGIKLVVVGAGGRMGKRIIALSIESGDFELAGAVEVAGHPDLGKDAGKTALINALGVDIIDAFPERADVVIDFSLPQATTKTLAFCEKQKVPLVLGTTGLDSSLTKRVQTTAQGIPLVYATNMSVGMNVLFALAGKVAAMLGPDYDIEIVEQHHRFKKDAPSGTAKTLAENICRETDRPYPESLVPGRSGADALRTQGSIGIHAVRAGDITGVHSVIYSTLGETVTLHHTAHTRDTFVRGALRAARWVVDKEPGLYSMKDVLGIE